MTAEHLVGPGGQVVPLERIALHAVRVEVLAPAGAPAGELLAATAPIPGDLRQIWATLDGAPGAWDDVGP